ncbi:hypothetical protein DPMN_002789 [Dreissena polymorpha]|uniref:Uncharacterized protein n=1 Tax=Dreissena polymorpha TaxID=45954 RepID=A0A9D4MM14_DREPO|nr:hypothetical protein DPMN_002789 [Dreissena polymorpha]
MSKFHEYWEKNVSSRLFTCCHYIHTRSAAARRNESMPQCGGKSNFAAKLRICPPRHAEASLDPQHDAESMRTCSASLRGTMPSAAAICRVNTRFGRRVLMILPPWLYCIKKTAPLPGGHVFSLITTIFKLVQVIHITNVLTKFHDD